MNCGVDQLRNNSLEAKLSYDCTSETTFAYVTNSIFPYVLWKMQVHINILVLFHFFPLTYDFDCFASIVLSNLCLNMDIQQFFYS